MVLMHDYFRTWAWRFCLLSVIATTATVVVGMRAEVYGPVRLALVRFVLLGTVVGIVLVPIAGEIAEIPFRGLMDSVLVASLRQARVFILPISLNKWRLLAVVVLSVVLPQLYRLSKRGKLGVWVDVLKCVAGLFAIGLLTYRGDPQYGSASEYSSASFAVLYVLLPLILLPKRNEPWNAFTFFPRIFIAALSAMELLQAYPVAGTQLIIGASSFLLWAFVCVYDGAGSLLELLRSSKRWGASVIESSVSLIGALVSIAVVLAMLSTGRLQSGYPFPPSSLPGSSSLHLPPDLEAELETLSKDVRTNCGVLFTMPGMGGFNLWSGVPTPDGFNEDNWMRGLPLNEQQQTLQRLESNPSACVIVRPALFSVWGVPDGGIETLPLARYILEEMPVVFRTRGKWGYETGGKWGYEIRVSPNRPVPWVEQPLAPAA